MELADTSAWTNREKSADTDDDFSTRLLADEIATCPIVVMELLWTTQDPGEFDEFRADLRALPQIAITGGVWERALCELEHLGVAVGGFVDGGEVVLRP